MILPVFGPLSCLSLTSIPGPNPNETKQKISSTRSFRRDSSIVNSEFITLITSARFSTALSTPHPCHIRSPGVTLTRTGRVRCRPSCEPVFRSHSVPGVVHPKCPVESAAPNRRFMSPLLVTSQNTSLLRVKPYHTRVYTYRHGHTRVSSDAPKHTST